MSAVEEATSTVALVQYVIAACGMNGRMGHTPNPTGTEFYQINHQCRLSCMSDH